MLGHCWFSPLLLVANLANRPRNQFGDHNRLPCGRLLCQGVANTTISYLIEDCYKQPGLRPEAYKAGYEQDSEFNLAVNLEMFMHGKHSSYNQA